MKKRFALVIGALGAGNTHLFRLLGSHPQVLPCRVAEPRFFTDDRKWALGAEWYASLFDFRHPDERVALEASWDCAAAPQVACPAERIAQMPAGFRLVYLLRDPVERAAVHHARAWREGWTRTAPGEGVPPECVDASRYARQLAGYRPWFEPEDLLLLSFEELRADPAAAVRRACRFLEIDPYCAIPALRELDAGGDEGREDPPAAWDGDTRKRVARELAGDRAELERLWGFDTSRWR